MKVNDVEYQCWHELRHAFVCIDLGGDVECVEFLEDHNVDQARARCTTNKHIRQLVACGGFAAELVLYRDGYLGYQDGNSMTQTLFRNATIDRAMYHSLDPRAELTEVQDREFMISAYNSAVPIIRRYMNEITIAVAELKNSKIISGERIRQIIAENKKSIKTTPFPMFGL
ncbi:hypothetical protein [Cellvibrio polysaccharolyticus]|uniref:Uncharacterized protein n=1 Tax=Cellvibrio polysaccharolyticus TaxID=2082724 RepID=A0A928YTY9_9GAMM|nr:hypothetical protein [Cellvibrio polysaccharolyticus]MBE8717494.1 hypothetical protein [Cellvibrio polysaccharolyticus]